ncbi:MAG: hypothetical protein LQ350_007908 [Teloschistes chrysophthalmus]|nr:MAG: hypothetical protein LQ350_007908 [Niorma chrysophthalma]
MTEASELSQTQFAPDVVFFDSDDEPSLGKEFHGYLARHGIIQQPSAGSGRAWAIQHVESSPWDLLHAITASSVRIDEKKGYWELYRKSTKALAGDSPERKLCQFSFARAPLDFLSHLPLDTIWQWRILVRNIFNINIVGSRRSMGGGAGASAGC